MKHGNSEPLLRGVVEESGGDAGRFPAEHQIVVGTIADFGVMVGPATFDEPDLARIGLCLVKGLPVGPLVPTNVFPVIHSSPLQMFVGDFETQRLNQVEGGSRNSAEPRDIACIWRDFRFDKDDMHPGLSLGKPVSQGEPKMEERNIRTLLGG